MNIDRCWKVLYIVFAENDAESKENSNIWKGVVVFSFLDNNCIREQQILQVVDSFQNTELMPTKYVCFLLLRATILFPAK